MAQASNRLFWQLYIEGTLAENGGKTGIHCRIRPSYPSFLVGALLLCVLVSGLCHVVVNGTVRLLYFLGVLFYEPPASRLPPLAGVRVPGAV